MFLGRLLRLFLIFFFALEILNPSTPFVRIHNVPPTAMGSTTTVITHYAPATPAPSVDEEFTAKLAVPTSVARMDFVDLETQASHFLLYSWGQDRELPSFTPLPRKTSLSDGEDSSSA